MTNIGLYLLVSKRPVDDSGGCVQIVVGMEHSPKEGEVINVAETDKSCFRFTNFGRFNSIATVIEKYADSFYSEAMNRAFPTFLVSFE